MKCMCQRGAPSAGLTWGACGGVVVDDAVQSGASGSRSSRERGNSRNSLMPVPGLALGQDRAVECVERRKQRRRPVAHVVVGDTFDVAKAHRQQRLRALQRLALALLVDAKHQRVLRRAHVQADDVAKLLDEERIGGELEGLAAVRRSPKSLK